MSTANRSLQAAVRDFFARYLPEGRQSSPNTIAAYRDAIRLLLTFAATRAERGADQLDYSDVLRAEVVLEFVAWLQKERGCAASTCNHRLSVVKSLAAYVARDPVHLERCRQIHELPRAREQHPEPQWLEIEEINHVIESVRPAHRDRDRALLLLMYDTGCRVAEIADLNVGDVRSDGVAFVQFRAKGGKQRTNVIGKTTLEALACWRRVRPDANPTDPLFVNSRGRRLTRHGIAWILAATVERASLEPRHAKRVTPHVIRHSTAMHLLEAGNDITVVAAWLGHASLETTNAYVQITLRMKQSALAALAQPKATPTQDYPDEQLLTWLDNLGRPARYVEAPQPNSLKSRVHRR